MQSFRVSRARVAGGFRTAAASRHTRVGPRARVAFALERGADGRRAVARGPFGKHEGTAGPFGPFEGLRRDGSKLKRGSLRFWDERAVGRGWQGWSLGWRKRRRGTSERASPFGRRTISDVGVGRHYWAQACAQLPDWGGAGEGAGLWRVGRLDRVWRL